MHIENEAIIATAYIGRQGDEKNQCFLSRDKLFIKYRGKITSFDLSEVKDLLFGHKMLLFPVVVGGIIAPLCLLALIRDFGNVWVVLSGAIAGLLLAYYGYEGSPTLTIVTKIKEFDFFIKGPTPNLKAFFKYGRQIIFFKEKGVLLYFQLPDEQIFLLKESGHLSISEPIPLLYYEETLKNRQGVFLAIDPTLSGGHIAPVKVDDHIVPHLKGDIKEEDILFGTG